MHITRARSFPVQACERFPKRACVICACTLSPLLAVGCDGMRCSSSSDSSTESPALHRRRLRGHRVAQAVVIGLRVQGKQGRPPEKKKDADGAPLFTSDKLRSASTKGRQTPQTCSAFSPSHPRRCAKLRSALRAPGWVADDMFPVVPALSAATAKPHPVDLRLVSNPAAGATSP